MARHTPSESGLRRGRELARELFKHLSSYRHRTMLLAAGAVVLCAAVIMALTWNQKELSSSPFDYPPDDVQSRRIEHRRTDPARIDDTLARFLYDWHGAPGKDRAAMARFFGFFNYSAAFLPLREEATRMEGESAVASLQALAAMGDTESIEIFREVLRTSHDCESVRVAAITLGAWKDHSSYSTLLLSLLRPRCGGETVIAQVQAILTMRHPFLEELLFLVHQVSTSPTAKLAAAAALAPRASGPRRRPVEATLRTALHSSPSLAEMSDAGETQILLLSLWGLGRYSPGTCREARDYALNLFGEVSGPRRKAVARGLLLAAMPCLKFSWKKFRPILGELLVAADDLELSEDVLERLAGSSSLPAPLGGGDSSLEEAWVDWLVQLATRFTLWDETRSVAQFAQAIERLERFSGSGTKGSPAGRLLVKREVRAEAQSIDGLERRAKMWSAPEHFDEYEFTGNQPEWWPSWIDITIDDGPRPGRLRKCLEVFDKWGVKATFFFIGVNFIRYWGVHPENTSELLNFVESSGHRIGYHSMVHQTSWRRHMQNWTSKQISDDIELFRATLTMALGRPWEGDYGRLPGGMGRKFKHVRKGFEMGGLKAHVHWNIQDPVWGPSTRLGQVRGLARRLVREKEEAVILLHEYEGLDKQLEAFIKAVHVEVHKEQENQASAK